MNVHFKGWMPIFFFKKKIHQMSDFALINKNNKQRQKRLQRTKPTCCRQSSPSSR